jgi:hypothetical protein
MNRREVLAGMARMAGMAVAAGIPFEKGSLGQAEASVVAPSDSGMIYRNLGKTGEKVSA